MNNILRFIFFISALLYFVNTNAQEKKIEELADSILKVSDSITLIPFKKAYKLLHEKEKSLRFSSKNYGIIRINKHNIDSLVAIDTTYEIIQSLYNKGQLIDGDKLYSILITTNSNIYFIINYTKKIQYRGTKCVDGMYCNDAYFAYCFHNKPLNYKRTWNDDEFYRPITKKISLLSSYLTDSIKK